MNRSDLQCCGLTRLLGSLFLVVCLSAGAIAQPQPVGVWDFDNTDDLTHAAVGNDLELIGSHQVIPGLDEEDGAVVIWKGSYYRAYHGTAPNGGGGYVNQYTLVMDVKIPDLGVWYSFYNTSADNSNDGDAFIDTEGHIGVGETGYSESVIAANLWHRVIVAVDLSAGTIDYYLNGELIQSGTEQGLDGRHSLYSINDTETPWVLLFADDSGDDASIYVTRVEFYDVALTAAQAAALQGPGGNAGPVEGLPINLDIVPPNRPSIVSISPDSPTGAEDITLTASEFQSLSEGATLAASVWQLSFNADFEVNADAGKYLIASVESTENPSSITLDNSYFPLDEQVYARVQYVDDKALSSEFSAPYSITLRAVPGTKILHQETFDSVTDGALPADWSSRTFSTPPGDVAEGVTVIPELQGWGVFDLEYLNTLPYYPSAEPVDSLIGGSHIEGKIMIADSGDYIDGDHYYETHLFSPTYDLSGVEDVYLAFNSDYVQNQDNIASLEYTLDDGDLSEDGEATGTWHPVIYYMDANEIVNDEEGNPDANFSFDKEVPESGGHWYDEYVFATQSLNYGEWESLSPYIVPATNDGSKTEKRFLKFRIAELDNESSVKFRWTYMGSWSWYWGLDNVRIYGNDGTNISHWSLY